MVKRKVPNIVRGGAAIPLKGKTNYYYMTGRKHSNGGIDIGKNPRTGLEVEDGEVMHVGKNEVKVFSSVPFLNGESPAEKVIKGDNPNDVFNAQESFKKRNKINDDGTKKKRMGEDDIQYIYNKVNKKNTPDFIRMRNPKRKSISDWRNNKYTSTNKVAIGTDSKGQVYLYNDIQDDGKGGLIDMSNPKNYKNGRYMGQARAEERGDTIHINSIQDGLLFSENYKNYYPGFPKTKRMGGLSRNKDYGSKSKPYPKVKSGDFAGGGRSYPIPTKADAVDALRLAGLHGRSDVKAKVYSKYPELRKKSKAGGLYSVTSNGRTRLYQFPSTGEVQKSTTTGIAKSAKRAKYKTGGDKETYQKESGTYPNWFKRTYNAVRQYTKDNPETVGDVIGLTSNLVGAGVSYRLNRKMLDKLKYSSQPIARKATKLKTRININPQLDKMRESLAEYERSVRNNTASSRVALARQQHARLRNIMQTNELYTAKENQETALINKDRLNQQSIRNANIDAYNKWVENKAAFENAIAEKKAENEVTLLDTINAGVQNIINVRDKRSSDRQTRLTMMAAYPNVNPRILRDLGVRSITDKDIENWDNAYGKK